MYLDYKKNLHIHNFNKNNYDRFFLVGDFGGTKTIIGVIGLRKNTLDLIFSLEFESYKIKSYYYQINQTLELAKKEYDIEISDSCFGVAGPVLGKSCKLSNLDLTFDIDEIKKNTLLKDIYLLNDFVAQAYAIINYNSYPEKFILLNNPKERKSDSIMVVIGAGTGFGKSIICNDYVFPSEASFSGFAPDNDFEYRFGKFIKNRHKKKEVVLDDVLSGRGLIDLFDFFVKENDIQDDIVTLIVEAKEKQKLPLISSYAKENATCRKVFEIFVRIFAKVARNIAYNLLPYKGLFVAGGIAQKNVEIFKSVFFDEFKKTENYNIISDVPIYIVTDPYLTLVGAANYILVREKQKNI